MSLISRLLDAVQSWRRRPRGLRTTRRAGVSMEQLDHRQLLSVNFTGNVKTDFPASTSPGVVVLPDNPSVTHPTISPDIAPIVKVSGFDINGLRVSYDATADVLSVGIEQPLSQQTGQPGPVIAGDADNNGNDGTVNPAVIAIKGPGFQDFSEFGGSEYMEAFLDLKGSGKADVVAGYSLDDPRSPKQYQVANAVVNSSVPTAPPAFGTELPAFEGNVYKVNSPVHPNLEFAINHFSQLYLAETGKTLGPNTTLEIGAAAGSAQDLGIGEAFFPEQPVPIGQATLPPTCPPVSPPITINPHSNHHINTAHPTLIRVNVLGSSGFDVTKIEPATVTLGGGHPVLSFDRFINTDEWLDATFVFRGTDVHLPRGVTEATLAGDLTNGQMFSSSVKVFNRDASFYTPAQLEGAANRQAAKATRRNGFTVISDGVVPTATVGGPLAAEARRKTFDVVMNEVPRSTPTPAPAPTVSIPMTKRPTPVHVSHAAPKATKPLPLVPWRHPTTTAPVVSIKRREPVVVAPGQTPKAAPGVVSRKLQRSLDRFVRDHGPVNVSALTSLGGAV